eukprot:g9817.t1
MKLKKPLTHICGWAKAKTSAKMWTDTDDTILHSFKEKKSTSDSFQSFHFERKRKFKCCGNAVELDKASTRAPFLDGCDKFIDSVPRFVFIKSHGIQHMMDNSRMAIT